MPVTFDDCEVVHETDKALFVLAPDLDDKEPVWIPQSQVTEDSEIWKLGQSGKLVITTWFAERQGWA